MAGATVVAAIVFVPMLIEALRASANEQAQHARGGVQPADDVAIYRLMQIAYPGAFLAMIAECTLRGGASEPWFAAGTLCFAVAKTVKWWAILTLGRFWTFRVIVVPGAHLVTGGPYRFIRHPNYVAVVGELAGAAMMTAAAVSGPVAVVLFGILLKRRISVEERALASATRYPPCSL